MFVIGDRDPRIQDALRPGSRPVLHGKCRIFASEGSKRSAFTGISLSPKWPPLDGRHLATASAFSARSMLTCQTTCHLEVLLHGWKVLLREAPDLWIGPVFGFGLECLDDHGMVLHLTVHIGAIERRST